MDLKRQIEDLVEAITKDKGLYPVAVKIPGSQQKNKIVVLIDGDEDVSIDAISEVSRALSTKLDEDGLFTGSYTLEVTSPGLDQPLTLLRQYKKNIGRQVKVLLKDDITKQGELMDADESFITIKAKQNKKSNKNTFEEVKLPFSEIKKTNVVASFK